MPITETSMVLGGFFQPPALSHGLLHDSTTTFSFSFLTGGKHKQEQKKLVAPERGGGGLVPTCLENTFTYMNDEIRMKSWLLGHSLLLAKGKWQSSPELGVQDS